MGAVYKEFRKSIHVIDPFPIPRPWRKVRGLDFGYNNPTGCVWVARDRDNRFYVYDEHYRSQESLESHAKAIQKRDWNYEDPWYGPTYSDHYGQERAQYALLGIPCTPAKKAINPGIELLRSLMMVKGDGKPQFCVFRNCENLIKEIQGYRWPEGSLGKNPKDEPIDKDNHLLDALRYAIFSDYHRDSEHRPESKFVLPDHSKHGIRFTR